MFKIKLDLARTYQHSGRQTKSCSANYLNRCSAIREQTTGNTRYRSNRKTNPTPCLFDGRWRCWGPKSPLHQSFLAANGWLEAACSTLVLTHGRVSRLRLRHSPCPCCPGVSDDPSHNRFLPARIYQNDYQPISFAMGFRLCTGFASNAVTEVKESKLSVVDRLSRSPTHKIE